MAKNFLNTIFNKLPHFTCDIAFTIFCALNSDVSYFIYPSFTGPNVADEHIDIAQPSFEVKNCNADKGVLNFPVDYNVSVSGAIALRQYYSALVLSKLESSGFCMPGRGRNRGVSRCIVLGGSF